MPVQVSSLKRNYVKLYLKTEKYIPSKYCCLLLDPFESLNKLICSNTLVSAHWTSHFTLLVIILLVFVLIETNLSSHSNVCLLRCKLLVVVKTWNSSGLYMG